MIQIDSGSLTHAQVGALRLQRPPAAGKDWQGIPHARLCEVVEADFAKRGWKIVSTWYQSGHGGDDFTARWRVCTGGVDWQTTLVWLITSNRRHHKLRLYSGVVSIGCVPVPMRLLGERKHVASLDMQSIVTDALEFALDGQDRDVQRLLDTTIFPADYTALLMAAGRERLMPWSRLGDVDTGLVSIGGVPTQWQVLLAFNRVAQRNPPMAQLGQMYGFYGLLSSIIAPAVVS